MAAVRTPHLAARIELRGVEEARQRLRLGVTEGCNLRCFFCHGDGGSVRHFRDPVSRFSPTDLAMIAASAADCGTKFVKITGGEPLLYRSEGGHGIVDVVAALASVSHSRGLDLSLVTNGTLLTRRIANDLKAAGLGRITISLHAGDAAGFNSYARPRGHDLFESVLRGIEAAVESGLSPVKINTVVYHSKASDLSNLAAMKDILALGTRLGVAAVQ